MFRGHILISKNRSNFVNCFFEHFSVKMNEQKNILSIKIVSVDHYNAFPIQNLDVNYSDFRESAVKQIPVVRIFGITQNKRKICAVSV